MRSIRLSLVIYFLLLLAGSLGAVSGLVYQTTAQTLRKKEQSTRDLIIAKYKVDCDDARQGLDERILGQAQQLAGTARITSTHYESLYPFGLLGSAPMPQGHLLVPLWLAQGTHPGFIFGLYRARRPDFQFDIAEDFGSEETLGHPREYFQVFRKDGRSVLRSETLGNFHFTLVEEIRQQADNYKGHFDNPELSPDLKLRRVTLKALVPRFRSSSLNLSWRLNGKDSKRSFFFSKGWSPGSNPGAQPSQPGRITEYETHIPVIFIQYASQTSLLDEQILTFQKKKNDSLADLENETHASLVGLGRQLLWICLVTFLATILGGFMLVRLGLAPLAKVSEAVSRVSSRDFRLQINQRKLPQELQPIVARLSETLDQLEKAFAREKQSAADISHELRTPLAALLTTLELALRKRRSAEEYRDLLQECQGSGQQMMHLVERLLALARLDAGADQLRPRSLDIRDLAQECAEMVLPLVEANGLTLQVHASTPLAVVADGDKIREVLLNLLHNAIEYNKPKGNIDLTVQREKDHMLIEVSDTGIGISAQVQEHIFERFYRADPSRHADTPHAGLGLSIVKSYMDLMGGTITVQSGTAGSTFRVELPC